MPIEVPISTPYVPAPAGPAQGVVVDVVDHGLVSGPFGTKPVVSLVFELDVLRDDGRPHLVSKRYTATLAPKSKLRPHVEALLGRPLEERSQAFDLELLLGANALLNVIHKAGTDGQTYARVDTLMGLRPGARKLSPSGEYVRRKDRTETSSPVAGSPSPISPSRPPVPVSPPPATDDLAALLDPSHPEHARLVALLGAMRAQASPTPPPREREPGEDDEDGLGDGGEADSELGF